jgi:hypothetical protein
MVLTAADATAELTNITTIEELRALIGRLDIYSAGSTTVFYSGALGGDIQAFEATRTLVTQGADIRVLEKTEARKFLDLDSNEALTQKLEALFQSDPKRNGSAAYEFLNGTIDANGNRTPNGIWDDVSRRFAAETTGDV